MRNRATVGGNLAQRPRCWYFRLGYGLLAQKDGKPLVPTGDNRYHAIFGNAGPAYFVSASSLAPALIAMDAMLTVQGKTGPRKVKAADFFVTPKTAAERENVLQPTDILTEIQLPAVPATSASYEVSQKTGLDWPLAVASVVLTLAGGTVKSARIVMGHVAPTPWRSEAAEAALVGKQVSEATATAAAEAALKGATPLSRNVLQGAARESRRETRDPRGGNLKDHREREPSARRRGWGPAPLREVGPRELLKEVDICISKVWPNSFRR